MLQGAQHGERGETAQGAERSKSQGVAEVFYEGDVGLDGLSRNDPVQYFGAAD